MKFCEKCGSYMQETKKGFSCTRCGNEISTDIIEVKKIEQPDSTPIDVIDEAEQDYAKVSESCPRCGNPEAFRTTSFISGEHAGVRQERSVERFTCTKCGHVWARD